MGKLDGKVAVVLGAATPDNMGQVMARFFAQEGAKVVVAGRHEVPLTALADEIGGAWALCDITSKADVDALCRTTVDRFGGVHAAVNATGWGLLAPLLKTSEEQLDQMLALQFKGPFFFFQAFTQAMADQYADGNGGGSIIQITSATATIMLDNHAAYMGAKAGADHVMRCFANEFGERGVKFNSIAPGLTGTPMAAGAMALPGLTDAFLKEYPLGRIGTAEDIAHAAVWLASDDSFMTGQVLQVNGGLTLRRNPRQGEIEASMAAARKA